jgi:hypothetical protein
LDETSVLASHLLCHSDAGGYYVPVDFGDPLFLPEEAEVRGAGMVGSSQGLLAELAGIASPLGISPGGAIVFHVSGLAQSPGTTTRPLNGRKTTRRCSSPPQAVSLVLGQAARQAQCPGCPKGKVKAPCAGR